MFKVIRIQKIGSKVKQTFLGYYETASLAIACMAGYNYDSLDLENDYAVLDVSLIGVNND